MPNHSNDAVDPALDAHRATREVVDVITATFADKTRRDVDRTMTHFSPELLTYTDTTIGNTYRDWDAQKGIFQTYMAMWAEGTHSYPVRILGDERSALMVFVDSPEMFGHEVRIMAPVDLRDGRIIRQVDYWDGRQIGVANAEKYRFPADTFPADFGEPAVGEQADAAMRRTATALSDALSTGDHAAAADLFTTDAVFEDLTLRTAVVGALAIATHLERSLASLPYGPGTWLRHTVGSAQGGGYEWSSDGPVRNGVVALELAADARISRLSSVWDASRVDTTTVAALVTLTVRE